METNRLEAFSDGVIAVIITIMVLELKVPHEPTAAAVLALLPSLLVYALSFLVVAIMWVNHYHFLHTAKRADAPLLWSNNNLLFWMSLIPFVTAYLGEHYRVPWAVAGYGVLMALTSSSFLLLQTVLAAQNAHDTASHAYYRRLHWKAAGSVVLYAISAAIAFVSTQLSFVIFVLLPLLYFWPERALSEKQTG